MALAAGRKAKPFTAEEAVGASALAIFLKLTVWRRRRASPNRGRQIIAFGTGSSVDAIDLTSGYADRQLADNLA